MSPDDDPRLSQISTRWTLIVRAHAGGAEAREALAELLPRYCAAVYRYVVGVLRDDAGADDLCQEFAYRFVRGDFHHARPEKGRFRDYVKVAVLHLVSEFRRRGASAERLLPFDSRVLAIATADETDAEAAFRDHWRRELLNRVWADLRMECPGDSPTLYDVLRAKAEAPDLTSTRLGELLTERYGSPVTSANARQMLRRARGRFAVLLRAEVAASVPTTDPAEVDAELADLGLLVYCPAAVRPDPDN